MSEIEERARAMGWVDRDEFRGDPDKWRPADEFVERGEKIMPILQERLNKFELELAQRTQQLEKVTNNLSEFAKFHKGTYKRAYDNAKRDIERKMAEARELGDFDAYDQALQEKEQLDQQEQLMTENQPVPEYFDFQKANPWYGKDVSMTLFVDHIAPQVAQRVKSDQEFFAELERATKQEFPHKFNTPVTAVEGADKGSSGQQSKGKKGWNDLPADARSAYMDNFSTIPGFTKEQYAKEYWLQEE